MRVYTLCLLQRPASGDHLDNASGMALRSPKRGSVTKPKSNATRELDSLSALVAMRTTFGLQHSPEVDRAEQYGFAPRRDE